MMCSNCWYSPWPEVVFVLDSDQGLRLESVVEEAVKGTEAIVEEVMCERHLADDDVVVKWKW